MLRWYSSSTLRSRAMAEPNSSVTKEWSITRSTGTCGLIRRGSPPSPLMASRLAARPTTAGTPVESGIATRAGPRARLRPRRAPPQPLHGVPHGGEVDHRGHAGEVLHQDAGGAVGDL